MDTLVRLAQAVYHGCRCLLGVHEFVDRGWHFECWHCGTRVTRR